MESRLEKLLGEKVSPEKSISNLEKIFKEKDIDLIIVKIITGYHLSKENLKSLLEKIKIYGDYINLIEKYLLNRKTNNFSVAFDMILYITNKNSLSLGEIDSLKSRIFRIQENTQVSVEDAVCYLDLLRGDLDHAKKPPWVSAREGENLSLLTTVDPGMDLTLDSEGFSQLLDSSTDIFYSFIPPSDENPNGGEMVKEQIPLDIRKTVQSYLSTISSVNVYPTRDDMAGRVFGPPNRFISRNCPDNLNGLGPCRMLCCCCRNEDGEVEDWFGGICDVCKKRILDKSHSVRYPDECGGWRGVYCSIPCLMESRHYMETEDEYIRILNMRSALDNHGIMDRMEV